MNLKDFKINLPGNWREVSRFGHDKQVTIKLYHISPVTQVDPKTFEIPEYSDDPYVSITKVTPPALSHPLGEFFEAMEQAVAFGLIPAQKGAEIQAMRKGMGETYYPEDGDLGGDITIAHHHDATVAKQSFKNIMLMSTEGFSVPIPGGVNIPGAPKDITYTELFKNKTYYKHLVPHVTEAQLKNLEEIMTKMDKEMKEKVKPRFEELGAQYKQDKYLGQDVIYLEIPNKPKTKIKKASKTKITGRGGSDDRLDPLPKMPKEEKSSTIFYHALLVNSFIITGSALSLSYNSPSGHTPCYSLTNYRRKITSFVEDGKTFTNITFVPLVSNLAKERYLHKEEMQEMLKEVIRNLKTIK